MCLLGRGGITCACHHRIGGTQLLTQAQLARPQTRGTVVDAPGGVEIAVGGCARSVARDGRIAEGRCCSEARDSASGSRAGKSGRALGTRRTLRTDCASRPSCSCRSCRSLRTCCSGWPRRTCGARSAVAVDNALQRRPRAAGVLELKGAAVVSDAVAGGAGGRAEVEVAVDRGEDGVAEDRERIHAEPRVLHLVRRADVDGRGDVAVGGRCGGTGPRACGADDEERTTHCACYRIHERTRMHTLQSIQVS